MTASTLQGEGPESEIVSETPQSPVPASIASFSRQVIHAVNEEVRMECNAIGQPKPTVEWSFK